MSSIPINTIVKLDWHSCYDQGYGFAMITSHTNLTSKAYLVHTLILNTQSSDPIHYDDTITAGQQTTLDVTLLNNGSVRFSKSTKQQLNLDSHHKCTWQQWDGQPIIKHNACD